MNEKNSYWYQLKDGFIDFLREKGYGKSSFTHYRGQIDFLIRYANALGYTEYSPEIGQAFLESEARLREWNPKALSFKATVIRRLDEYINGRNYTFARLRLFYQCPECFESELEAFLQTLRDEGYKEITIRQYRTQLVKCSAVFRKTALLHGKMSMPDVYSRLLGNQQIERYSLHMPESFLLILWSRALQPPIIQVYSLRYVIQRGCHPSTHMKK